MSNRQGFFILKQLKKLNVHS